MAAQTISVLELFKWVKITNIMQNTGLAVLSIMLNKNKGKHLKILTLLDNLCYFLYVIHDLDGDTE